VKVSDVGLMITEYVLRKCAVNNSHSPKHNDICLAELIKRQNITFLAKD